MLRKICEYTYTYIHLATIERIHELEIEQRRLYRRVLREEIMI